MATVPSGTVYLGKAGFKFFPPSGRWSASFIREGDPPVKDTNDRVNESTDYTLTGLTSTKHTVVQGTGETSPNNGRFVYIGGSPRCYKGESVWFQIHLLHPPEWDYVTVTKSERCKFMRMRTFDRGGASNADGYNDIYVGNPATGEKWRFHYEGKGGWTDFGADENLPQSNSQWEEYQMMVTLDDVAESDGGQGRVLFWRNDELLADIKTHGTLLDPLGFMESYHYNSYWSNFGAEKTQSCYWGYSAVTNRAPSYTDALGNPKLPPRNI